MAFDFSALGWTLGGIAGGGLVSYLVTRRYIHRPRLSIRLDTAALLLPQDFDEALEFRFAGAPVHNLLIMTLTLENQGTADILVPDAAPPRPPTATLQPFLHFEGIRVSAVRTTNNDVSRFNIPIGRAVANHRLYLNIHRIRAHTTARFQIIGTFEGTPTPLSNELVRFFPGAIPNIDIATGGALQGPWLTNP
jgi:hypothetical protein